VVNVRIPERLTGTLARVLIGIGVVNVNAFREVVDDLRRTGDPGNLVLWPVSQVRPALNLMLSLNSPRVSSRRPLHEGLPRTRARDRKAQRRPNIDQQSTHYARDVYPPQNDPIVNHTCQ
jgi:hypothetical protein